MKAIKTAGRAFEPGDSFEMVKADSIAHLVELGCDPSTARYLGFDKDNQAGFRHYWAADVR